MMIVVVVVGVDHVVKDFVDFRLVLQIDGIVHLQSV